MTNRRKDTHYNGCEIKSTTEKFIYEYKKEFKCGCYFTDNGWFGKDGHFIPNLHKIYKMCDDHKKQFDSKTKTWKEITNELIPIMREK